MQSSEAPVDLAGAGPGHVQERPRKPSARADQVPEEDCDHPREACCADHLTAEAARCAALARQLEAVHLGLRTTSVVIGAPSSPGGHPRRLEAHRASFRAMAPGDWASRRRVLKPGAARSKPIHCSRLSTNPVVRRWAMPNRTFTVRPVWMAVSLQGCWRPRLPVGAASRPIAGSNQIVSDPRRLSASPKAGQFLVLRARGVGLPTPPGYHAGSTR